MNIETEKLNLIQLILSADPVTFSEAKSALRSVFEKKKETDFWDELSKDEKDKVEISLQQIKEGKTKSYSEVEAIAKKALNI